jgi:hypothetical protein
MIDFFLIPAVVILSGFIGVVYPGRILGTLNFIELLL